MQFDYVAHDKEALDTAQLHAGRILNTTRNTQPGLQTRWVEEEGRGGGGMANIHARTCGVQALDAA